MVGKQEIKKYLSLNDSKLTAQGLSSSLH